MVWSWYTETRYGTGGVASVPRGVDRQSFAFYTRICPQRLAATGILCKELSNIEFSEGLR